MTCTRCGGSGFLNSEQYPNNIFEDGAEKVQNWIAAHPDNDLMVCDCCGNGDNRWYGEPGQHYTPADPSGHSGPYAYNGGLCECH